MVDGRVIEKWEGRMKEGEYLVRVLRLVEYCGPRSAVENTVARSVQGTKVIGTGLSITAVTLGIWPDVVKDAREQADPKQLGELIDLVGKLTNDLGKLRTEAKERVQVLRDLEKENGELRDWVSSLEGELGSAHSKIDAARVELEELIGSTDDGGDADGVREG